MNQKKAQQMLTILEDAITELAPGFHRQVRSGLAGAYKPIWDLALPLYKKAGRFYDLWHIPFSTRCMQKLCEIESLNTNVFIPAVILHDIGYSAMTGKDVRIGNIDAVGDRELHMQFGAQQAIRLFAENDGFSLSDDEQKKIIQLIEIHDNPYIGKKLMTKEQKLFRDADRIYVLSFSSFTKDYLRKVADTPSLTPQILLSQRISSFHGDDMPLKFGKDGFEAQTKHIEPLESTCSQQFNEDQIVARQDDIEKKFFEYSLEQFRVYCRKRLVEELQKQM